METNKLQKAGITSLSSSIGASDCVKGVALVCHEYKVEYVTEIGKGLGKMFFMHGKQYDQQAILNYTEAIIDTYKYESPETILLFLKKAAQGDFGKFYGDPDIGTIREWFADFLQKTIIPERENQKRYNAIGSNDRGQERSLREYIEGSCKVGPINIPSRFKGLTKS